MRSIGERWTGAIRIWKTTQVETVAASDRGHVPICHDDLVSSISTNLKDADHFDENFILLD